MDDLDFMCDLAVQAMEDCAVEIGDTRGAKEAGYEALLDFDVDGDRKRIAVEAAADEYFAGLF